MKKFLIGVLLVAGLLVLPHTVQKHTADPGGGRPDIPATIVVSTSPTV